jgi:hypothetical protein
MFFPVKMLKMKKATWIAQNGREKAHYHKIIPAKPPESIITICMKFLT